jgi:hypothetical protein
LFSLTLSLTFSACPGCSAIGVAKCGRIHWRTLWRFDIRCLPSQRFWKYLSLEFQSHLPKARSPSGWNTEAYVLPRRILIQIVVVIPRNLPPDRI